MEAIHDEVVRGVLVDDNGVWVDDEVLVQVHDEQVDDNEVLVEVHEVLVEVHEVLVDDTLEVVEVAEVQDGIVNEVSVVHDEEVARVHERVEEAVGDSEDDAQVVGVEVEVREQEAVHDSVVVGGNMDSNLEVEVHGRPTPHSPRRQVQLLTPLKMELFAMYHEIQ